MSHRLRPAPPSRAEVLESTRVVRRVKAALAILRVKDMLDLTDEDLRCAVSIVLEHAPECLDIQISTPSETVKFNRGEQ